MHTHYKKIMIIGGVAALAVVAGTLFFTYLSRFDTPAVVRMRTILRLPAMRVDGERVRMDTIERNTASIKQFYEIQDFASMGIRIDFSTEDGQKRLKMQERQMLNKIVEDIAIAHLARDWGISLRSDVVSAAVDRPMEEMGTREQVIEKLHTLYGWTLADFEDKVVRPQLLRDKVMERYDAENTVTQDMHDTMRRAKKELDDGRSFDDVARKYSEGSTAEEGGIMGWFSGEQIQDEIGKKVFTMAKGEYTDIIETPLGLHIVRVNDTATEEDYSLVHVSQIVVKKKSFGTFLEEYLRTLSVRLYMPGYAWDTDAAAIVFTEPEMQAFEEKAYNDAAQMTRNLLQGISHEADADASQAKQKEE